LLAQRVTVGVSNHHANAIEEGWMRGWTYRALEKKRYRIALPSILGSSTIDAVHRTTETTSVIARIAFQLSAYLSNTSRTHVEQC